MLRTARHAKILEIIGQKEIETQEELCSELNKLNYVVTQATISRDIKDLHLFKVSGIEKKYRYAYINDSESEISPKMKGLFRDCVVAVKSAQNLVVIKTLTGNGPMRERWWTNSIIPKWSGPWRATIPFWSCARATRRP